MQQTATLNRRVVLASRPHGAPTEANFRIEEAPVPVPGKGQILLRTQYLSLDPYMRGRMSDGPSYRAAVEINEEMVGGTVCRVEVSEHPDYKVGDVVVAYSGWQDYALSDGSMSVKLDPSMKHTSLALGVLGMPGFTAYIGLLDIGQPKPGETVVVAAASGAVGAVVGQIAKLKGAHSIGIAGGATKTKYLTEELGFDAAIDHKAPDFAEQLKAAAPNGIDVYFENVGGKVLEAVMPLLNVNARVPLCGFIAHYNATNLPEGPDRSPLLLRLLLTQRITMKGFIVSDHFGPRFHQFFTEMLAWVQEGKVKFKEDIVEGLENTPEAFIGLLEGKNFGKLIVKVSD